MNYNIYDSYIDYSNLTSEDDLREMVRNALKTKSINAIKQEDAIAILHYKGLEVDDKTIDYDYTLDKNYIDSSLDIFMKCLEKIDNEIMDDDTGMAFVNYLNSKTKSESEVDEDYIYYFKKYLNYNNDKIFLSLSDLYTMACVVIENFGAEFVYAQLLSLFSEYVDDEFLLDIYKDEAVKKAKEDN